MKIWRGSIGNKNTLNNWLRSRVTIRQGKLSFHRANNWPRLAPDGLSLLTTCACHSVPWDFERIFTPPWERSARRVRERTCASTEGGRRTSSISTATLLAVLACDRGEGRYWNRDSWCDESLIQRVEAFVCSTVVGICVKRKTEISWIASTTDNELCEIFNQFKIILSHIIQQFSKQFILYFDFCFENLFVVWRTIRTYPLFGSLAVMNVE